MPKYIFVTGGVLSGLGKGIVTASIAKLLQARGFKVTAIKCDGYLNYDAGTLRPTEHGEVWVTYDGGEIDQDLGHYERFLDVKISKWNNITSGQIYWQVIKNEREGKYLGKTVQLIPHVTNEIKRRIRMIANDYDFTLVEIGGTVGDYENVIFIEAARQLKQEEKALFVHVSYVPVPKHLGEAKTKPTQLSVKNLLQLGIQPDFIIARSEKPLDEVRKQKIAMFSNLRESDIISDPDVEIVYEVPLIFETQGLGDRILEKFGMRKRKARLAKWQALVKRAKNAKRSLKIGIVGKYFKTGHFELADSYISVIEAVKHAAWKLGYKPEMSFLSSQDLEKGKTKELEEVNGIIVPGGFGSKGVEGKINAIRFARENGLPFLGLCFGMQLAVVEFARNVCGLRGANSTEIDPRTPYPVIDLLPWQRKLLKQNLYGATMRLGEQKVKLRGGTLAAKLYGRKYIYERFRHRYEVNPKYVKRLERSGLIFSGTTPDGKIMQIVELPDHPFFIGTQFHPEFTSRPLSPNPLFLGFVKACAS